MRKICEEKYQNYKDFISINGDDINMNISDDSVDFVLSSQSYHRFNPKLFKKECNRVLKDKKNIVIMWYRIDFEKPIYSDMLLSVKNNYKNYQTRYDTDEIIGSKKEESENNNDAKKFLGKNAIMKNIISKSYLNEEEFIILGLSLSLFPITHKMNNVSDVLKEESFNKDGYINDLKGIFNKYAINEKVELEFNVQIHSNSK